MTTTTCDDVDDNNNMATTLSRMVACIFDWLCRLLHLVTALLHATQPLRPGREDQEGALLQEGGIACLAPQAL